MALQICRERSGKRDLGESVLRSILRRGLCKATEENGPDAAFEKRNSPSLYGTIIRAYTENEGGVAH